MEKIKINLNLNPNVSVPVFNTTKIHAEKAIQWALK